MKRKKLGALLLTLALAAALLCACGAAGGNASAQGETDAAEGGFSTSVGANDAGAEPGAASPQEESGDGGTDRLQNAKLIYTANLEVETTDFEQTTADLDRLVEQLGGYYAQTSIGNYGGSYRSGSFTVRVPAAQFQPFCDQVGKLCHLTYKSSSAENVTDAYYDTEIRLATQRTKLERLQALLAKADEMEGIIALEEAISETELEIDYLSGSLRQYDSLVDFATVSLTLSEVYRLSNTEEPVSGFGARLGAAFSSGWKGFVTGVGNLMVALAYGWVWLLVLAAGGAAAVVLLRRRRRRRTGGMPPQRPGGGAGEPPRA